MKKSPHVIWVCPTSRLFYRAKGEVRCRLGSIIPKLTEHGMNVDVLIPNDPTLLPKTKLSPTRITRHKIHLSQDYPIDIIKLTRGAVTPGIYMVSFPTIEPALSSAIFTKAAIALAHQLKRPVDIFHLFDWEVSLLPLFLELEKNGNRLFKNTRTFLNVSSLRDQGNFPPSTLNYLGIPKTLFHPEGLEFFGKVSYLKAGLMFSDGVGVIEGGVGFRKHAHRNGTGLEGVLDAQAHKLRRWASERSLRSHLDAYKELLSIPPRTSILPQLMAKVNHTTDQAQQFIESWGPVPPDRYFVNGISFLIQSPTKAYVFWEWNQHDYTDYGLVLEDRTGQSKKLVARGLYAIADYWLDVAPDHEYVMELVGFLSNGTMQPLLRSRPLRTPRNRPSSNTRAVFVDVRDRRRFPGRAGKLHDSKVGFKPGGTSAFEWSSLEVPSSFRKELVSSR